MRTNHANALENKRLSLFEELEHRYRPTIPGIGPVSNGLQVTSAIWRCVDDPNIFNEVTGTANSLVQEAKSLTVKPENRVFGDPCNKHKPFVKGHHKNLEITYVFRGNKLLTEYDEPHTLTLTEKWRLANAVPPQEPEQTISEDAPALLLRYVPSAPNQSERLAFINDGPRAVIEPKIGPVRWRDQRDVEIHGNVGTIEVGGREEHNVWVVERAGTNTQLFDVYDTIATKVPSDSQPIVTVTYGDAQNRKFSRDFVLATQSNGGITWTPGPVRPVSGKEAR